MSGIREEFEAWLRPDWSRATYVDGDGDTQYVEDWVQGAWIGWQASRAALKVELPDRNQFVEYYEGLEGGEFNWRKYLTAVTEALQQAGIEVVK